MNYGCADTYISKVGPQTRNLVGSTKNEFTKLYSGYLPHKCGAKSQSFRDRLRPHHHGQCRKQSLKRLVGQRKFSGFIDMSP